MNSADEEALGWIERKRFSIDCVQPLPESGDPYLPRVEWRVVKKVWHTHDEHREEIVARGESLKKALSRAMSRYP